MTNHPLSLKGFKFHELFLSEGLERLDKQFLNFLHQTDELVYGQLLAFRSGENFSPIATSELIIQCGPILEAFLIELFDIEEAVVKLQAATLHDDPIHAFKKYYVLRKARRLLNKADELRGFYELDQWVNDRLKENGLTSSDRELMVAIFGQKLLDNKNASDSKIEKLSHWCVAAMTQSSGQAAVEGWVSFTLPKHLDYENLVEVVPVKNDPIGRVEGPANQWRYRDGFQLTDPRMTRREVLDHVHYCVYCHKTDGDFCSKGFPVKKGKPEQGLKINPLGETLTGCPLDEKISEMHTLKKDGFGIAALAAVMIDNPMCPATGHRICNDCMKGCIYQKQEPVNIPEIETRVLTDVLDLPWGVEIYDLLTRWNPLRKEQYVAKPYNGKKVLIMGMGPAGFTLAHHLLMEGFAVVGTDGLKIEPLPQHLLDQPIYSYQDLKESLENRVMAGFGGVAEYGITVRWDKNFLKLIYISLMRRPYFQVFGSIRFGGTLWVEDAWQLGFDHLSIAVGAGLPRELHIPHSLAPGMRQANDFLMALQLTGAAKPSSLANLQVRLPAVIIGGGLTGIDTATEVQAYYISQVEKTLIKYQTLVKHFGENTVRNNFDRQSLEILDEFLVHGHCVKKERERAVQENRKPNFIKLIREWGGVTIAYRRTMQESPAYKRNHEEVIKALEEGIYYAEGLEPKSVQLDEYGHVKALTCRWRVMDEEGVWMLTDEEQMLPARAIFIATGAKPNIAYAYEHRGTFVKEGNNYQRNELQGGHLMSIQQQGHCKMPNFGPFTSYEQDHHRVSFLGDTHPIFHGSVVKAIASGKRAYPKIVNSLIKKETNNIVGNKDEYEKFRQRMETMFHSKVLAVRRHTPDMVELKVRTAIASHNFRPGQFYRLQNYECLAPMVGETRLQTEAMAMIGASHPNEPDVISFMVLERGVSSRLVATFQPGQHISMMGPTGCWSDVPKQGSQTMMIIGGSMAAAHLRSLGPAFREKGHRVFYVGCLRSAQELYCCEELEDACDMILWLTETSDKVKPGRKQDLSTCGELITVLRQYAMGELTHNGEIPIPLDTVNRVIVVGSSTMIRRVQEARSGVLQNYFSDDTYFFGSVYGPMQCMLKGVCAQCLQWQIDPETGKRTKAVYACSWQHQPLEMIDISNIDERLLQNRTQEILSNLWLDYLFATHEIPKV